MPRIRDLIFPNFNSIEYFDKWLKETQGEDNFEEHVGFYDHIKKEFIEEMKSEYALDNNLEVNDVCELDSNFKKFYYKKEEKKVRDLAYDWYFERLADFSHELEKVVEITDSGVVCFRSLLVDDLAEFTESLNQGKLIGNFEGIGTCWAWHEHKAEAHWGKGSIEVVLKGIIPFKYIEEESTMWLNLNPSLGREEAEIRVQSGKAIEIISINDAALSKPVKINS